MNKFFGDPVKLAIFAAVMIVINLYHLASFGGFNIPSMSIGALVVVFANAIILMVYRRK